ncbi:fluoride efflux transporter CrcB [Gammaproteobacteria bacterium]|nr:fluoride efflux transporter CrcB [Gammaproteobacteria bacterium]
MLHYFVIGAGGALGAMLRFFAQTRISALTGPGFPWGTLLINISGSFFLGALVVILSARGPTVDLLRSGLCIGLLGGFTTFSAFSVETLTLLEAEEWQRALVNIVSSVLLCLLGAAAGLAAARQF